MLAKADRSGKRQNIHPALTVGASLLIAVALFLTAWAASWASRASGHERSGGTPPPFAPLPNLAQLIPWANSSSSGGAGTTTTATITLRGHISLQGRPTPPDPLLSVAANSSLRPVGAGAGAASNYAAFTADSGYFTVTAELAPGDYLWYVKNPQTLAVSGTVSLVGGLNALEIGTLRTGDADNNNVVSISDYNAQYVSFGRSVRDLNFDPRTDFNGDSIISISDFNLLKNSFGRWGADRISTPTPTP